MVPSYLVAEEDYFKDRLAGLLVLDKSIIDIRQTVDIIPKPWEGDGNPIGVSATLPTPRRRS